MSSYLDRVKKTTAEAKANALVDPSAGAADVFEQYGHKADRSSLPFMKFKDGDFFLGADNHEIEHGTVALAVLSDLMIGWQHWANGMPDDEDMGMVTAGFTPKRRDELGDDDESDWETDPEGRPRDPWQFSNKFPLVFSDADWPLDDTDENAAAFVTGSRGGIGSIGRLCKAYGHHLRTNPDELPVVEIGMSKYYNKKWDRNIKTPEFKIIGWSTLEAFQAGMAEESEDEAVEEKPAPKKRGPKPKARSASPSY